MGVFGNRVAVVVDAIRSNGPTIIIARSQNIDLIAPLRTVFVGPDFTRCGMHRHALGISVAVGENFLLAIGFIEEWISARDASIVVESNHAAVVVAFILSGSEVVSLTQT